MSHQMFNLQQAADHVHMDAKELKHCAQRGEIDAEERSDGWWFEHRALDEWAQRNVLAADTKEIVRQHGVILDKNRRANREDWRVWELFSDSAIVLDLKGKAKAGILRDMTDLADRSGLVYDPEGLFKELQAREEIASTAIGEGAAFLHARFHDPYMFQETFIAYGRSERPVFFGAPDGQATRHFFLICSTDHEQHLQILSRLAMMAHATEFLKLLDEEVASVEQVVSVIRAAEEGLFRT